MGRYKKQMEQVVMGTRHDIFVEYTNGHVETYATHCYQFKKTKMYRQLMKMLDQQKIKNFTY